MLVCDFRGFLNAGVCAYVPLSLPFRRSDLAPKVGKAPSSSASSPLSSATAPASTTSKFGSQSMERREKEEREAKDKKEKHKHKCAYDTESLCTRDTLARSSQHSTTPH